MNMNEVKKPKKPLIYYYAVVVFVLILFNSIALPWIAQRSIREVDYGTFMEMIETQEIGQVQVQENQIIFTDKDNSVIYKTGVMNDPTLVERLRASGAKFSSEIVQETSPLLAFLLTWILPLALFIGIGQLMSKK